MINESLELICARGYVMQIHGYRGTADVDAFYKSNIEIDAVIRKIGDEFGINKKDELWLNNSIGSMNPEPPVNYCEIKYQFSNLTVKTFSILYLIGMKFKSGRRQDLRDIATIIKNEQNEQPLELLIHLNDMKFSVDISVLLDVYEMAYGMEWLEIFYVENQNILSQYF